MPRAARPAIGAGLLLWVLLVVPHRAAAQLVWVAQAPGPNTQGQVENIDEGEVVGAINTVVAHPTDANVVYVGAVNGGIWMTANAMATRPTWRRLADGQRSLSVGALNLDPTDASARTLVAGMGRFSSYGRNGGPLTGLIRTTDGGVNWSAIDGGGLLSGLNVTGVASRGPVIVVSVNTAGNNNSNPAQIGIWRSPDTGATWRHISGTANTGLPNGASSDLAGDPASPNRLYTNAGRAGLFRSDDAGATWRKVSSPEMDALLDGAGNVKTAVGGSNNVFVAIVRAGRLAGVFRSGDGGGGWASMGMPTTPEGGAHPGAQGGIHLSIAADRTNPQVVYVGGDRQPSQVNSLGRETYFFPNSIGARDYSGRLFRGDASKPLGSQWVHLTHSRTLGAPGGGTASGSAPHADSRDMAVVANGVLVEVDDGGVYRRTSPGTNAGDWFSMNGDIQVTEFHSIAWDANSKTVIGGAQDTGVPEQRLRSGARWRSVNTADGGVVAVDDISTPGFSTRYTSVQSLSNFKRQVFNAANVFQYGTRLTMTPLGSSAPAVPQFYTPIKLNSVVATRLIIGASNSVYESLDQGTTVTEVSPGVRANGTGANSIAYGAAGNPEALYVGSGARVFIRTAAPPAALTASTTYPGDFVTSIALDPTNFKTAYVIDPLRVFRTTDAGATWANITGNLQGLGAGQLRTVVFSTGGEARAVVVGSDAGVFQASVNTFTSWSRLGTGLPVVPVYHLEYDPNDRVLLAGTLGRGAWTLNYPQPGPVPAAFAPPPRRARSPRRPRRQTRPSTRPQGARPARGRAAAPATSAQPSSARAFQLRPGVVVDPARSRIYIMKPGGGIDAVGLRRGEQLWSTRAADKPLGVVNQLLVSQADPPGAENVMKVAVLDPSNGTQRVTGNMDMPQEVLPTIDETLRGKFVAAVASAPEEALVAWKFEERPEQGMLPGTEDTLAPPGGAEALRPPQAGENSRRGAFTLDLSTGETADTGPAGLGDMRESQPVLLEALERLPGLPETQVLSADGRHVMVGVRTGDDRVWEKYTLSIYERETGRLLGSFRSHLSLVPFVVNGSQVIYEVGSYARRTGSRLVEEPLQIRALDLRSGKRVWSRQIRDTAYRGPFPP